MLKVGKRTALRSCVPHESIKSFIRPYNKTVASPKTSSPQPRRPTARVAPSISPPRKIRYRQKQGPKTCLLRKDGKSKLKKPVSNIHRYFIFTLLLAPSITFLAVGVLYGYEFSEPTSKQVIERMVNETGKETGKATGRVLKEGPNDLWIAHIRKYRARAYGQPWLAGLYIYGSLE
ncbi:hypothetical protein BKA58DRAFT_397351 [Alternaria rosae]|uniref:uncharacterized protein n=1 Tax=Alternaria rosae TaxID=1187941 RepID=UPI001E8CA561|nr:uncharacterized protein BKA58DRAFT_397351 [Alternaria rosae]KAH6883138.1 hypothetical protein BKA58DRAFT_397351 [Alternaria rosae]